MCCLVLLCLVSPSPVPSRLVSTAGLVVSQYFLCDRLLKIRLVEEQRGSAGIETRTKAWRERGGLRERDNNERVLLERLPRWREREQRRLASNTKQSLQTAMDIRWRVGLRVREGASYPLPERQPLASTHAHRRELGAHSRRVGDGSKVSF